MIHLESAAPMAPLKSAGLVPLAITRTPLHLECTVTINGTLGWLLWGSLTACWLDEDAKGHIAARRELE